MLKGEISKLDAGRLEKPQGESVERLVHGVFEKWLTPPTAVRRRVAAR